MLFKTAELSRVHLLRLSVLFCMKHVFIQDQTGRQEIKKETRNERKAVICLQ